MKVVICWSGMQGYVAACLRALDQVPGVDIHVFHLDFCDLPFQEELLAGISNERLVASAPNTDIADKVAALHPDVILLCGWFYPQYRQLAFEPRLGRAKFVLGMDTPWTGSWQQRVNQVRLKKFMRRMAKIVVAGTKSADFARRLDAAPGKIVTGFYGFDFAAFCERGGQLLDETPEWPKKFLYAGRYVPEKGLPFLMEGYQRYRQKVADPWPLHCCGTGPEADLLKRDGVRDLGYVQPSALPELFAGHGVFVMPSLEEPWGVAIGEAAATGLPLVCSEVCGAAVDLLRPFYNGVTVPPADAAALANALEWMHNNHDRLRTFGHRSRNLAHPFSAEAWAERLHACFNSVVNGQT
ncbi:MAG: glycosyltransferase family 4 protein [Vicinamibacterales bacterium]